MSTYTIYFTTAASCVVEVEADDFDEAVDAAYDQLPSGVCAQCAGWGSAPGIDLGGDWEADVTYYQVDGKSVEVKR